MIKFILIPLIIISLNIPIENIKPEIEVEPEPEVLESLGEFKITAYSLDYASCGKYPDDPLYGITRSGRRVTPHHTVASDWDILPEGTKVTIEGFGDTIYTVEDTGGAVIGKHIDVYMENPDNANDWGLKEREVWIVNE